MKLTNVIYFDDEDGSFVAEKFYINGEECNEEDYEGMLDQFDNINKINEEECEGNCDECENVNDECDCPNCTIEKYVEQLVEITGGCPGCIHEVLEDFMMDIVDHIVIEDMEEDMVQEGRPLN